MGIGGILSAGAEPGELLDTSRRRLTLAVGLVSVIGLLVSSLLVLVLVPCAHHLLCDLHSIGTIFFGRTRAQRNNS